MVHLSQNAERAGERVRSFLLYQTQQGDTYVPGRETPQSRSERLERTIKSVNGQFTYSSSSPKQAQGGQFRSPSKVAPNTTRHEYTNYNGMTADLYGAGQQFQGYGHQ